MSRRLRRGLLALLLCGAVFLLAVWALRAFVMAAYPVKFSDAVEEYSEANGLPVALVYGVIHTESGFRPEVVSPVGARGLMQITEDTFDWAKWRMGDTETVYDDLYDPETNIRYGAFILRLLIEEFDDTSTALAAYHAGWGSVKGWLEEEEHSADGVTLRAIPFKTTARYVPRVNRAAAIYRTLYQ